MKRNSVLSCSCLFTHNTGRGHVLLVDGAPKSATKHLGLRQLGHNTTLKMWSFLLTVYPAQPSVAAAAEVVKTRDKVESVAKSFMHFG